MSNESFDTYITALKKLSESCGFGALRESLVRDRLILGVKDDRVRQKFLGKRDLDVDKGRITNLPPRTLPRLKSVCFVLVRMHCKGNCVQLQVRNGRTVVSREGHFAVKC